MYRLSVGLLLVCLAGSAKSDTICCNAIGCFNEQPPFNHMPLPLCMEDMKKPPLYYLFTRLNPTVPQLAGPTTIPPNFQPNLRTIFVAHGYINDGDTRWLVTLKDALVARENANVIIIDWEEGANNIYYPQSAANTRSVGAYTSLVINKLITAGGASAQNIWCMGHSLGAHLCGHAGMQIKIGRVTGMDPAGPWFEHIDDVKVGINPSSAYYVDIIHTDNVYGTARPLGHIDFYPNGGNQMPGCMSNVCSHMEVTKYMIESVKNDCFKAYEICSDSSRIPRSCERCSENSVCAYLGYAADKSLLRTGYMYLTTKRNSPYCENR